MVKPTQRMRGAVIVTRVSSGEQVKHSTSPETQLEACRQKALALSLPIVAEYYDAGISGAFLLMRGGMQSALADIREGRADTLICPNLSRYSRDEEHQHTIRKEVRAAGGRIVFCDMDFEDTPEGDLNFTIQGGFAAYERKVIRKRTMEGRRRKAEQGIQTAMKAAYGYHVPTKADVLRGLYPPEQFGRYVLVPEAAWIAGRVYANYDAGQSLHQILRGFMAEGIPSPTGNPLWGITSLRNVLRNPIYKGTAVCRRWQAYSDEARLQQADPRTGRPYVTPRDRRPAPEAAWITLPAPPIVDEATWDRVQRRLDVNKERRGGNPGRARMLSGRLFCPRCGAKMAPYRRRLADGTVFEYYACVRYAKSYGKGAERACEHTPYAVPEKEADVNCALLWACRHRESITEALATFSPPPPVDVRREMAALDVALDELGREESATVQAQIRGMMAGASADAYAEAFAQIAARRKDLADRRGVLKKEMNGRCGQEAPKLPNGGEGEVLARALAEAHRVLTSPDVPGSVKRDILGTVVERVVCQPEGADVTFVAGLFGGDTLQCMEVQGMGGDVIALQDIFRWEPRGVDSEGRTLGETRPTGLRPRVVETMEAQGVTLPPDVFG